MSTVADKYRAKLAGQSSVNATDDNSVADKYRTKLSNSQSKRETPDAPLAKKPEMSTMNNIKGGIRALGQGMTFNLNDEAASAMGAFGGMASDFITGDEDDRGFGERYSDQMEASKTLRDQYSAANPKTALGLEIAGAFTGGGAGAAKVLSTQAVKNAPKLKKAIAASLTGGTEGAVMGFGSGNSLEDRIDKGKTGLGLGLALPLALSGAGALTRGVSNKYKMDKPLEVLDGTQMPLNLADDGWRGTIYRDVVSNSFGGGRVLDDSAPFIQRAEDKIINTRNSLNQAVEESKKTYQNNVEQIKTGAIEATDNVNLKFRQDVINTSLPTKLSDDAVQMLSQTNNSPQQVAKLLQKEWVDNGFDMIKGKYFDVDDTTFINQMKGLFDESPDMNILAGDYIEGFTKRLKQLKDENTTQISGKNFMALRNEYAKAANNSGADLTQAKIFRTISNKIDNIMTENLPKADKAAFQAEKTAYDSFVTLKKATGAAKKKGGQFTPNEWLSGTSNQRAAFGSGAQQKVADNAVDAQAKIKVNAETQKELLPKNLSETEKTAFQNKVLEAKRELQELNTRIPPNSNLWNKMLSTKLLSLGSAKLLSLGAAGIAGSTVGGPIGAAATMAGGTALARALSGKGAQRFISGQSVDQTLNKLSDAKVGGLSLADILRQGTTTGAIQGQNE